MCVGEDTKGPLPDPNCILESPQLSGDTDAAGVSLLRRHLLHFLTAVHTPEDLVGEVERTPELIDQPRSGAGKAEADRTIRYVTGIRERQRWIRR